jgi:propionyl-CoA carboxylase beta chain
VLILYVNLKKIINPFGMEKLSARQRLLCLFDERKFEEIGAFIQQRHLHDKNKNFSGDGVITGFGTINGKKVFAFSQDSTFLGGTSGAEHCKKIARIIDLARDNKCPIIGILDSGGARIQEGVLSIEYTALVARKWSEISGYIPNITLVCGACAGGSAYISSISDFNIIVENQGYIFLTGPKVIEKVLNEKVTFEELGGASVHSFLTGISNQTAINDLDGITKIKQILSYLPQWCKGSLTFSDYKMSGSDKVIELNSILPKEEKSAYDKKKIINYIVDADSFFEIHPDYATSMVVGFGRMANMPIGIIANNPFFMSGSIDYMGCKKAARFMEICDAYNIPIVFLADSPGILPGKDQEVAGILGSGGRYFQSQAVATNPKITLILRKLIGGAYGFMGPKMMGTDLNFAWPQAQIAVVGSDAALEIIFSKEIKHSKNPKEALREKIEVYKQDFLNPYKAASQGFIDKVIMPEETRITLIKALKSLKNKSVTRLDKRRNIGSMG